MLISCLRHTAVFSVVFLCITCSGSSEPTSNDPEPSIPENSITFNFDDDELDNAPDGFSAALTGAGEPVLWRIEEAADAPSSDKVVAQRSDDRTNARYPLLVRDDFSAKDVDLSVSFKTLSGDVDASGGLVFRYEDEGNYYVVRANSLEGNVVAYKTEDGKRSNIGVKGKGNAYGVRAEVPHQAWNRLRVVVRGIQFQVFLNGRKLFEAEDSTFTRAGRIGLWTKADAVTQFDDLTVAAMTEEPSKEAQ